MPRYQFLKDHDNQTHVIKTGWVVEMAEPDAAPLIAPGTVKAVSDRTPLKKGNLENYDNCRPLSLAAVAARTARRAKEAPTQEEDTPGEIA